MAIKPTPIQVQQPFAVTRVIAGKEIDLTVIDGELYLTARQIGEMLELDIETIKHHVTNIIREQSNNPGYKIYVAPVLYARDPFSTSAGGGGGTKQTNFYSPSLALAVAMRMLNTPKKANIVAWLTELVNERVNTGG